MLPNRNKKCLVVPDIERFLGTRALLLGPVDTPSLVLWVGACGALSPILPTLPQFSVFSPAPCSWRHLPPDMSGQNQLTHGGVSAEPRPAGTT